jgi:hypothetical protein
VPEKAVGGDLELESVTPAMPLGASPSA